MAGHGTKRRKTLGPDAPPVALPDDVVDALAITDPDASITPDARGNALPDADLRDNENVPLSRKRSAASATSPT